MLNRTIAFFVSFFTKKTDKPVSEKNGNEKNNSGVYSTPEAATQSNKERYKSFSDDMENGRIILTEDLLESKEVNIDGCISRIYLLPDGRRIGELDLSNWSAHSKVSAL